MNIQSVIVLIIIALAVVLALIYIMKWRRRGECDTSCGNCPYRDKCDSEKLED